MLRPGLATFSCRGARRPSAFHTSIAPISDTPRGLIVGHLAPRHRVPCVLTGDNSALVQIAQSAGRRQLRQFRWRDFKRRDQSKGRIAMARLIF